METEPNEPDVLNNLAAALEMLDRMDEANLLVDEVIEKHPDYFFAKIATVARQFLVKNYDEAHEILVELSRRERLHVTEFTALAKWSVLVSLRRGQPDASKRWLEMLEEYAPNNPEIPMLSQMVSSSRGLFGQLRNLVR